MRLRTGGGSGQGAARRILRRRNRFRPGESPGLLFAHHQRGDLRLADDLRLSGASGKACSARGGIHAGDKRSGQDLCLQDPQGDLLCRGRCVQREEARADRGGLRLLDQTFQGSRQQVALRKLHRWHRGTRGAQEGRSKKRQDELRHQGRRIAGAGQIHAADQAQGDRLQLRISHGDAELQRGRARGHRRLRRRHQRTPGWKRPLSPQGVEAFEQDRP